MGGCGVLAGRVSGGGGRGRGGGIGSRLAGRLNA